MKISWKSLKALFFKHNVLKTKPYVYSNCKTFWLPIAELMWFQFIELHCPLFHLVLLLFVNYWVGICKKRRTICYTTINVYEEICMIMYGINRHLKRKETTSKINIRCVINTKLIESSIIDYLRIINFQNE